MLTTAEVVGRLYALGGIAASRDRVTDLADSMFDPDTLRNPRSRTGSPRSHRRYTEEEFTELLWAFQALDVLGLTRDQLREALGDPEAADRIRERTLEALTGLDQLRQQRQEVTAEAI